MTRREKVQCVIMVAIVCGIIWIAWYFVFSPTTQLVTARQDWNNTRVEQALAFGEATVRHIEYNNTTVLLEHNGQRVAVSFEDNGRYPLVGEVWRYKKAEDSPRRRSGSLWLSIEFTEQVKNDPPGVILK